MVDIDMHDQLRFRCQACGLKAWVPSNSARIVCVCGHVQLEGVQPGLGDWIAACLRRCGITRYRYQRIKKSLGLNPSCKCEQRQEWLNRFGKRVGLWLDRFRRWLTACRR